MRVMDDLTKLRNHYYVEYMNKLTDKVEEQRQDIQRKTDQLNRRIQRKELQEVGFTLRNTRPVYLLCFFVDLPLTIGFFLWGRKLPLNRQVNL